jgi:hypothetical protein
MRTVKTIEVYANGISHKVIALFDTGATLNYIRKALGEEFQVIKLPKAFKVGLGGRKQSLNSVVILNVKISQFVLPSQYFHLANIKKFDVILGAFFLEQWGIALDPKKKILKISKERIQLQEEFYEST